VAALVLGVIGGVAVTSIDDTVGTIAPTPRNFPTDVPAEPDQVAFQIGGFDVGCNIDQAVWGPSIVVYADGTTIASSDGPTGFNSVALGRPAMATITSAAQRLPDDPELGTPQWDTDATPFLVRVGDRMWDVWDDDDAVDRFVATIRREVDAAEGEPWRPERWFVSTDTGPQVATERSDGRSSTPVLPHQLERYATIGSIRCFRDSAVDPR
jgi:hypothetical protein